MPERDGDAQTPHALPRDRFDELPHSSRVGAHRVTGRPRRFWAYFLTALIAIVALTVAGILVLNFSDRSFFRSDQAGPAPTHVERVTPQIDPSATVVVLNGTPTPNLAAGVDHVITQNQWGTILFSDDAATNDVAISAVFYSSPEDEAAAAGLAAKLGGVSTYQTDDYGQYGARLIVLLGADYAGPGESEAEAITKQLAVAPDAAGATAGVTGAGEETSPARQ